MILNPPTANLYVLASYTGTLDGTFSVTGVPSGYTVDYDAGTSQIRLVKDGFSAWALLNGLSGTDTDDFDNDGLADGVEYVLGTSPLTSSTSDPAAPVGAVSGDNFTFTFRRDHAAMTADISLAIEVGTDLDNFGFTYVVGANTATSTAGVTVTDNGTYDTVTLTIARAPDDAKFARLRVTVAE